MSERLHRPTARDAAIMVLHLLDQWTKEKGRELTRARISQITLRKLCGRAQIPLEFLEELRETLLASGWCLFCTGPTHYAVVKASAVEGWRKISSKRVAADVHRASRGLLNFDDFEHLLLAESRDDSDSEDTESQEANEEESKGEDRA